MLINWNIVNEFILVIIWNSGVIMIIVVIIKEIIFIFIYVGLIVKIC